mgnify:CR=1 FL=1
MPFDIPCRIPCHTTIAAVRKLVGAASASDAIDVALEREIRTERPRGDIAAYAGVAPSADEVAIAAFRPASPDLADDTDWEALYGDAD